MKILIIDSYYPVFLHSVRKKIPRLINYSYDKHLQTLLDECFGTSDFYSYNLRKIGADAIDIIANDEILQKQWARENGLELPQSDWKIAVQNIPYIYRFIGRPKWMQEIVLSQIKLYKPDIVYIQDLTILDPVYLGAIKKHIKLLVGQIASPLPQAKYLKQFDLILTSFPHFVEKFRNLGIISEYFRIGFEPRILEKVEKQKKIYDVVFIGSFSSYHKRGIKLLEEVASRIPIHIWGTGIHFLSPFSPLRKYYHGEVWGSDMYKILAQSKIVLNRHIDIAGNYANNMRMFESTGMGVLLITDKKRNNNELFKVGREIEEYENADDLINKIKYYLIHDRERKQIAKRGQRRTLYEHSYKIRMEELKEILFKYM